MKANKRQLMRELAVSSGVVSEPESQDDVKEEKQKAVKLARGGKSTRPARAAAGPARQPRTLKQMTIKLGPEVRSRLLQESIRRKAEDAENWPIQQIITEAVNAYLGGK